MIKIFCLSISLCIYSNAMEVPNSDDEVQKITDQVQNLARPIYEKKIKDLLQHQPFKENPDYFDFLKIVDVCTPHYAPLLKKLLEKKIVNPNTSLSSNGMTVDILSEAVHFSLYSSKDYIPKNRLSAVKILLEAGACADKVCVSHNALGQMPFEWNKIYKDCAQTPLSKAITLGDRELASLLLQHHSTIKDNMCHEKTPLMQALERYFNYKKTYGMENQTIDVYRMVELLVKSGADLNVPSKYDLFGGKKVSTPMQLARESGCTEIVALFEQYQRGKQ